MSGVDRRGFIRISAGALAAAVVPGCASVAMTRVTPSNGVLRLPLRDHPQLAGPGGYLRVLAQGSGNPIYVLATEDGDYAALSPVCTHLGCTVEVQGPRLVCPCHGSTYDRDGEVLRGPAERRLARYPVEVGPEGDLLIRLEPT